MDRRVFFALIGIWSLISCTDHSSIIEGIEPDTLLLSKEDSLSFLTDSMALAQENLRDSLRNEGWYSFNSFSVNEAGILYQDSIGILKPGFADSISRGYLVYLPAFEYQTEQGNSFTTSYPCISDSPPEMCKIKFEKRDIPNDGQIVLQNLDTIGVFFNENSPYSTGISLYLLSASSPNTFEMAYYIRYTEEWKHTAWCIAYSAHRYK